MTLQKVIGSRKGDVVMWDRKEELLTVKCESEYSSVPCKGPVEYLVVSKGGKHIAVSSQTIITIYDYPIKGILKERTEKYNVNQPIVWIGWHPQSEDHIVALSSNGLLNMYNCVSSRLVFSQSVKSPLDYSLKCRSASFMLETCKVDRMDLFTLLVLLESSEIICVSPLIPNKCLSLQAYTKNYYLDKFQELQSFLKDITENLSEFDRLDYENAVKEVELLQSLAQNDNSQSTYAIQELDLCVQGPFLVHPEPSEQFLSTAHDIYAVSIAQNMTVVIVISKKGRVDIYALLDKIRPRWSFNGKKQNDLLVYLVDSVDLHGTVLYTSMVDGMESDLLVVLDKKLLHVSLLPLIQSLKTSWKYEAQVKIQELPYTPNPQGIAGWLDPSDTIMFSVDGSITRGPVIDCGYFAQSVLSQTPAALDLDEYTVADKKLLPTLDVFKKLLGNKPSLKSKFEQGALTVADLQLLHMQISQITQSLQGDFSDELKRAFARAKYLQTLVFTQSRLLAIEKNEEIDLLVAKQTELEERAKLGNIGVPSATHASNELQKISDRLSALAVDTSTQDSLDCKLQLEAKLISKIKQKLPFK